ncbi:MAG: hypothetical protein ACXVLM_02920, partial [Ilumatobacteraceae bacterium]
ELIPSTDPKMVSVAVVANKDTWYAAVWSLAGNCMYIKDSVAAGGAGTLYGKGTAAADCTGAKALSLDVDPFYKTGW